ncbi:MAG: phosphatase PAP2 family protein [Paenibacillaceae bacterium]
MFIIHSMTDITIGITLTVFMLIWLATRKIPFYAAGSFVQEVFTSRKFAFHFIALIAILFVNKLEQLVAGKMHFKADFTPSIYSLEGDFVAWFQQLFMNDTISTITIFIYVFIFPSLMIASLFIYTYQKNYKMFYAVCYGIMFNYLIAIPFYLFFSVDEVWSFRPDVQALMLHAFPTFETDYRPTSGISNCFPSLHTSISVSMAYLALQSKNKFWGRFTLISCTCIIFSIFYLGIHWLTDMFGGLVLGVVAARLGIRISECRAWISSIISLNKNRDFSKQTLD